jgi:hypothetical protein
MRPARRDLPDHVVHRCVEGMAALSRPKARRGYEEAIRGPRDARSDVLEMKEPRHLVELSPVAKVRSGLAFLEDRGVDPEVKAAQQREDLVANRLWVLGRVEHAVEVQSLPPELAP